MRLMCTVFVANRACSTLPVSQKRKHVKSTLALCKHPNTEEYCLILFTATNKTGTKYPLKGNIKQVLVRFINEGKATIQLNKPEHDLYIQADPVHLKTFVQLFKKVLQGKVAANDKTISSMSVTAIKTNVVAPKKMVILKRSDYPLSFPRTIEVLQINGIRRCGLDRGVLNLCKLRVLDLNCNLIEFLPIEINKLPNLTELDLSYNHMGVSAPRKWDWMSGRLTKTLKSLNLSENQMKYLPDQLARLQGLVTLRADRNELTLLPSGVGNLKNLKIFSASYNKLVRLPGSARKWRLDELDLSRNSFNEDEQSNPAAIFPKPLPVCSLKEYAAQQVLLKCLPYDATTIPMTLVKYMELARYCVCGKACFQYFIRQQQMLYLTTVAKSYCVSASGLVFLPMDCYFCSVGCFRVTNFNRAGRIIR